MITSFSLPGLPSEFSLRMPLASWGGLPLAIARVGATAAETPNAESTEANRKANILRLEVKFIDALLFPVGIFRNHGNAKLNRSLPAAMATYCFPPTAYVMGEALEFCPVLKCQIGFPVCASTASNDSASSAKNSSPPAVVMVPPDECPRPLCGYFQASSPVDRS